MSSLDWYFVKPEDLPDSIKHIVILIGFEATVKLLRVWAGQKVYIPNKAKGSHHLAQLIGIEALEALVGEFGGLSIRFPRCKGALIRVRNRRLKEEYLHKITPGKKQEILFDLARRERLSAVQIRNSIKAA